MRHAAALQSTSGKDFERVLSEAGRQQAAVTADYLKTANWIPDFVLVSAAVRTQETVQILSQILNIGKERIHSLRSLYYANAGQIEEIIRESGVAEQFGTLLVLAHNPGISQYASSCCEEEQSFYFNPASVAGFELDKQIHWEHFSNLFTHFSFFREVN